MKKPLQVVGCLLEHDGRFVLLHRRPEKPHGGLWGLPGGKVDLGETSLQAMVRELQEETGYAAKEEHLEHLGTYTFDSLDLGGTYVYATYRLKLDASHAVILEESSHTEAIWTTPSEANARPDLVSDLYALLKHIGHVEDR